MSNNKNAETRFPIHELLAQRWSPRAFTDQDVDRETVGTLLEAARWAASCFNDQPWSFFVGMRGDSGTRQKICDALVPANRTWAQHAPVLMMAVARLHFRHNEEPNGHAIYDVGAAVTNLVFQAESMGLGVHQMAGFDAEKARELFAIPDGYQPVVAMAIGYRGDPEQLEEGLRQREVQQRERVPLQDIVMTETWGNGLSF